MLNPSCRPLLTTAILIACSGCGEDRKLTSPTAFAVNHMTPNTASSDGGTSVAIIGTGFRSPVSVTLGGAPGVVTAVTPTSVTVTTPARAAGRVDVVIRNGDGEEVRLTSGFTFLDRVVLDLGVTHLEPREGFPFTWTRIFGTAIQQGATVTFGGVLATPITTRPTEIVVTVPGHGPGTVDVVVMNPDGRTVTVPGGYTFLNVTVTVSTTALTAGGPLSVTWKRPYDYSGYYDADFVDYLRLHRLGDPDDRYVWWLGVFQSAGTFDLLAPSEPGQYEFRFVTRGTDVVGRSATIVVSPAAPQPGSTLLQPGGGR